MSSKKQRCFRLESYRFYEVGFTKKFQKKYGAISDASNALTINQYAYSPPRTLLCRAIKKNRGTSRASRGYNFHLSNGAEG